MPQKRIVQTTYTNLPKLLEQQIEIARQNKHTKEQLFEILGDLGRHLSPGCYDHMYEYISKLKFEDDENG